MGDTQKQKLTKGVVKKLSINNLNTTVSHENRNFSTNLSHHLRKKSNRPR